MVRHVFIGLSAYEENVAKDILNNIESDLMDTIGVIKEVRSEIVEHNSCQEPPERPIFLGCIVHTLPIMEGSIMVQYLTIQRILRCSKLNK